MLATQIPHHGGREDSPCASTCKLQGAMMIKALFHKKLTFEQENVEDIPIPDYAPHYGGQHERVYVECVKLHPI